MEISSRTGDGPVKRAILWALLAGLLIKIFIFDFMIATGHSMVPVIEPGTILLVCKVFYGIKMPGAGSYLVQWRSPREGEIVVFYTPLGEIAVKRCREILPDHMFYAMGDNILQSYDSRNYGPVPSVNIIGKVLGIR